MGYLDRIDDYQDQMVKTLQELIAIPSVEAPAVADMPFGMEVHRAFTYMMDLGKAEGFETVNVDNFGGHLELSGDSRETMGVLVHLDVVPEGNDWDYPPYEGRIVDGRIYGRGTTDDKGPAVAAFYAMKALKDEGFVPRKNIRLILGLDEEAGTGWLGMKAYFGKVEKPDFGFTPDAEFPAIHGEMGILIFELAKKLSKTTKNGMDLRSITGGNAANMVADHARAVLRGDSYDQIREALDNYRKETGYSLQSKGIGKNLEITAQGVSSHGARPEKGLNAISVLLGFLSRIEFASEDVSDFLQFYQDHIGFSLHGEKIGCNLSDDISGELIFNVGMINMDDEAARLTINVRYPVTMEEEAVYRAMMPYLDPNQIGVVKSYHQPPIYVPADDPLITTLMEIYQKHTGDLSSKPLVIGGGTYARSMEKAVAFGMTFPGEPELAHQKNESLSIEHLVKGAKIFAECLYELTK